MTSPMRAFLRAFAVLFLLIAGTAHAAMPPKPAGPVLDQANIIPDDQEAALTQRLSAYNAQTGRAIIVATVASLDGLEVADYAQQLAETWDIGGEKTEQGILFLVAQSDRKMRIHAARGVQERLPDVLAGRILRDYVTPRFKAEDYAGGINSGVDQIIAQLNRDPADAKAVAEAAAAAQRGDASSSGGTFASAIFWIVLIIIAISIFGRRKQGYGQRRSGIDPGVVLWGLSEIARAASHSNQGSGWSGGGSDSGGGFGGFGGGGGGFDGGGASGDW